jgi:hypothetical protein
MRPMRPAGTTVAAPMGLKPTSMAWSFSGKQQP